MTKKIKTPQQAVTKVFMVLSIIATVGFSVLAGAAFWTHNFTTSMVHRELAAQKIYFPAKGSPALDPQEFPGLQQYAGQPVDNGDKARAYANEFIAKHLEKVAGGKKYAEVSTAAMQDPTNEALQKQKQTLFQGETLRGVLLGTGYAFGMIGKIAGIVTYIALAGAGLALIASVLYSKRYLAGK